MEQIGSVALLSGILRKVMEVSNISGGLVLRRAAATELRYAVAMILSTGGNLAADGQVSEFFRLAAQRGIELGRVELAISGDRMLWAVLPIASPGRTLLVLSPNSLFESSKTDGAERLIRSVCQEYARQDCKLAQVLLDPAAETVRSIYLRIGFKEMAELEYLQAPVRRIGTPPELPSDLQFATYSAETHDYFARAIQDSYANSLDCPALNGLREIEDVIEGHRAAGQVGGDGNFDPLLWRVVLRRSVPQAAPEPCGVLLLCRTDPSEAMELVYLGVSPSAGAGWVRA